jgi:uncharacterized protein HemY
LSELGIALAQTQCWQEAGQVWQEIERINGSITNERSRSDALRELGIVLAQAQHWQEVEWVINTIVDEKVQAYALRELGIALAQTQHWQEAERVIASISDEEDQRVALTKLVQVQESSCAKRRQREMLP